MTFPDGPRSELERSIEGLMANAQRVLRTQGRLRSLLQANHLVVEELELEQVLRRIVQAAADLVGARYAALGVIAPDGHLEQFLHTGLDAQQVEAIGPLPSGRGILGAVIDQAQPIRLEHLGRDPRSSGFPANHPTMEGFLGVPIRVRGEVFGNLYLTTDDGRSFSDDDEELVEALAATAGAAISNARLYDEAGRRERWSSALAEVTAALLSPTDDGQDVLTVVADRVAGLIDADEVCIIVPESDSGSLRVAVARGHDAAAIQGHTYPAAGTLAARAIAGGYAVASDSGESSVPGLGREAGPTLVVPLIALGQPLGVLSLSRAVGGARFSRSDVEMASEFGTHASVAIEMARGRADSHRLELVEDRNRIARDLHDHVIQRLFGAGLALQGLSLTLPATAREQVADQIDTIDAAIADIRTAVFALSTKASGPSPKLRHRVLDIVSELAAALPSSPRLSFSGPVDTLLVGDLAADVTAVVRETLSNVARHAAATTCSVTVSITDENIEVVVEDDGRGFAGATRSSGTRNLADRAAARGGEFTLTARDPSGTRAAWVIPLPGAAS